MRVAGRARRNKEFIQTFLGKETKSYMYGEVRFVEESYSAFLSFPRPALSSSQNVFVPAAADASSLLSRERFRERQ